jgi:protein disulfide-isomerase A1
MRVKSVSLILMLVLGLVSYTKQVDNIIDLHENDIEEKLKNHEYVVILFTQDEKCPLCRQIGPEYEKAAEILKQDPSIKLARYTTQMSKLLTEKYKITHLPTLKVMRNGEPDNQFNRKRTHKEIISWAKKYAVPLVREIKTAEELEAFVTYNSQVVISFGEVDVDLKQATISAQEEFLFATCVSVSCLESRPQFRNKIILFQGKEAHIKENSQTVEDLITEFILPGVNVYTQKLYAKINSRKFAKVFYVDGVSNPSYTKNKEILTQVASKFRKVKFIIIDIDSEDGKYALKRLNLETTLLPCLKIFDTSRPEKRYEYPGEYITLDGVEEFLSNFQDGKLIPTPRSEGIPTEQTGLIYKVVQKTFEEVVINSDKNVLIKYYNTHCGHCTSFKPVYEDLARKLKDSIDNLLIAEIDVHKNEMSEKYIYGGVPTIIIWLAKDKSRPAVYDGKRTVENLVEFVHTTLEIEHTEPSKSEL